MWTQGADESAWMKDLRAAEPSEDSFRCARFVLQAAAQCNEIFVGNETRWLLQLLAAPSEDERQTDVIASVLEPAEEGTRVCCTVRGSETAAVVAAFVDEHPDAPALIQLRGGAFEYVLCGAEGEDWTRGPLTLARLRHLWTLPGRERLAFYLPAERDEGSPAEGCESRFPTRPPIALSEA